MANIEKLHLLDEEGGCGTAEDSDLEILSWRGHPLKNHSDWIIEVGCEGSTSSFVTYNVHKAIISVGPRRCNYFSTLFQTKALVTEKNLSSSRIILAEPHANAFPLLLDFCYGLHFVIDDPSVAVSLRNVSNYFGCHALRKLVNEYIEKDLKSTHLDRSPVYWILATMHDDDVLADAARRICAEQVESLEDEDILQLPLDL